MSVVSNMSVLAGMPDADPSYRVVLFPGLIERLYRPQDQHARLLAPGIERRLAEGVVEKDFYECEMLHFARW